MSEFERNAVVFNLTCTRCGAPLELPPDLTAVYINCPQCGADNVLAPELIQSRQRQHDYSLLVAERARQAEQQRLLQQRVLAARQAASRRNTIILWTVLGIFLVLPIVVVVALVAVGISFGKKASHQFALAQDPKQNGMPALMGEIAKKKSEGCDELLAPPGIRFAGAGTFHLPLRGDGPCVHLMGATSVAAAKLTLAVQGGRAFVGAPMPGPAPAFDYRFCPNASDSYDFVVTSSASGPFSIAAITCPRTRAEGLMRSKADDPVTTELSTVVAWSAQMRRSGCHEIGGAPTALQGSQIVDVDSIKGGPCFNLLVASHFGDALLAVKLVSPSGKSVISPAPATRIQLEYCPNETGRHRVEITPTTRDHFSVASLDCPKSRPRPASQSSPLNR